MNKYKPSFRSDALLVLKFFRRTGLKFRSGFFLMVLALLATLLEGAHYVLLIPTAKSLIGKNAEAIRESGFLAPWVNKLPASVSASDFRLILLMITVIFMAALLKNVFQAVFQVNVFLQTKRFSTRLRQLIYERYLTFGKQFYNRINRGYLQHLLMSLPAQSAQNLHVLYQVFYSMAALSVNLFLMFLISRELTLVSVLVWPLLSFSNRKMIHRVRKSSVRTLRLGAELARKISDTLSCMFLIKAVSFEEAEKESFKKPNEALDNATMSVEVRQFLIGPIQETAGLGLLFLLMSWTAYRLIGDHSKSIAEYLVFFLILRRSMASLGIFARVRSTLASMHASLREQDRLFSDEHKFYVVAGDRPFEPLQDRIRFERLNFRYPGGIRALKNVSFEVKKGQTTALVGPTGAGKTTLTHLLMRFYDCPRGTIFADGQDLCDFSLKSFHERVAFIGQETLFFNDTIRMNLTYGLQRAVTPKDLEEALERARLTELMKKLPKGLDTAVGDLGVRLSGGEKQRLSVARALLRNTEILVMDEATGALDSRTEALIQEALRELVKGKTALVVANRFSTIRYADSIVVMDEGEIKECGSLDALLEAKGVFWELREAQKFY